MIYVPDNYDMFLIHEREQERLKNREQEELEEIYGPEDPECLEDRDREFN